MQSGGRSIWFGSWMGRRIVHLESIRELIFEVREAPEGAYTARAIGETIFVEAEDRPRLDREIRDTVECHCDVGSRPGLVRPHFVARPARQLGTSGSVCFSGHEPDGL
jgi:hypothetical protein